MTRVEARVVLVTRKTPLTLLRERLGTRTQAEFYLKTRGQRIEDYERVDERFLASLSKVVSQLPATRRRARVERQHLDRFLFEPEDIVVFVGQDGLVANAAKYLRGQLAIGINPDPESNEGVLVPHAAADLPTLLSFADEGRGAFVVEERTMVEATREDGQKLLALNEIFIGHRSHQSARYRITLAGSTERQSSSGVIVSTGTGATGWTRSISTALGYVNPLPKPGDRQLVFFVREAWPSVATGATITQGAVDERQTVVLASDMPEDGLAFGDGIESDPLEFLSGHKIEVGVSAVRFRLVQPIRSEIGPGKQKAGPGAGA